MKDDESIESRIQQAMGSRVQHFRDLADSLTFEGVRRLLEKDLELDEFALDKHKKYVKQLVEKFLSEKEDDENVSKGTQKKKSEPVKKEQLKEQKATEDDENVSKGTQKNKSEPVKKEQPKEQKTTEDDEGKIEDSPVMGLLSGKESDKIPTEDMIKEAIRKRATYFRSKSEELTVAGVRRLIEEDLELKKFSLDSFKKLISKQLDEVLNSKSDDDSSHSESENLEVEVKPKKKATQKAKAQKSEAPKKRKKPAQETERPKKKKVKTSEETSVQKKKVQDSDNEKSESSAEKSAKKEVVAPVYGKEVERLKSIIKACGMSVAPTVYRKAKQAPENKREKVLVKELEEILSKEGLSANPSEKEIKEVKRRKERAKELEGIDTSNIVMGSRRRSTSGFIPPPRPKAPIESDGDDSEDSDDDDNDSEDSDNEDGDDKVADDDKDGEDEDAVVKDADDEDEVEDDKVGDDDEDADVKDADDEDGDDKIGDDDADDDDDEDGDVKDGDDEDMDDKVDVSKSKEVTGDDETV